MTTQINKFVIAAAGATLAVYLGASVYALVERLIEFPVFIAAVGTPLGLIGGWVGKTLTIVTPEKLLS